MITIPLVHHDYEFLVGIVVGKILLSAVLASALFRSIALAAAAIFVCITYLEHGVPGIMAAANLAITDFSVRPEFAKGVALGAVLAFLVFGVLHKRRRA